MHTRLLLREINTYMSDMSFRRNGTKRTQWSWTLCRYSVCMSRRQQNRYIKNKHCHLSNFPGIVQKLTSVGLNYWRVVCKCHLRTKNLDTGIRYYFCCYSSPSQFLRKTWKILCPLFVIDDRGMMWLNKERSVLYFYFLKLYNFITW